MVSWVAKLSEALFVISFSIWSRRFLPEADSSKTRRLVNGIVSVVVLLIDIVDVVFDCMFAKSVVDDMEGGSLEWGITLVVLTVISHLVDVKSLLLDMSLAENCVTEIAIFYIEDVTMIMLIGNVNGAYDPSDPLDVATVSFSAVSALVTIFQLGVQIWRVHATGHYPSGDFARRVGLLVIAVLPSCLFLGLLGELLIDGNLVLNEGAIKWVCDIAYSVCISFGLAVSFRVLIRPVDTKANPSEEIGCENGHSECHADYELT